MSFGHTPDTDRLMPMGSDLGDTESRSRISMVEIGRVDAMPMCVQASVCPKTPGRQSAGQSAPVLPDALAECARSRACSRRTVSKWTNVGPVDHARKDVCNHRCNRRPKVGSQPCRSRQCSPTPMPSVRGHGHAAAAPFLNGQKSVLSAPCQYVCEHRCVRRPKVGNQPVSPRQCFQTPLPSVRGHGHAAAAPFLNGQMSVP